MRLITFIIVVLCSTLSFSQWEQVGQDIFGENDIDFSGVAVSMNDSGTRIAVYDALFNLNPTGRVRVFDLVNGSWSQVGNDVFGLVADNISSGNLRLNGAGNRFVFSNRLHNVNGLINAGGVRVFELQNGSWNQLGNTMIGEADSDLFGSAIDINSVGNRIIVSAQQSQVQNQGQGGYVKVFDLVGGSWIQTGSTLKAATTGDWLGKSVSISGSGHRIVVAAPFNDINELDSGLVQVYDLINGDWVQRGSDIYGQEIQEFLGLSLEQGAGATSINFSGSVISIGARGYVVNGFPVGRVFTYRFQNNEWMPFGGIIEGDSNNDSFGVMTILNKLGNVMAVGDLNGYVNGSVKVFQLIGDQWTQVGDTLVGLTEGGYFGQTIGMDNTGSKIIVGSPLSNIYGNWRGYARSFENQSLLFNSDAEPTLKMTLYPNPNKGTFAVKFNEAKSRIGVTIFDVGGRLVYAAEFFNTEEIRLNKNLQSGVYAVSIQTDQEASHLKMIVN